MAHKTPEELAGLLEAAAHAVPDGSMYTHYKDQTSRYVVVGHTILEATDEPAVRYSPVTAPIVEFTRPLGSWLEVVEYEGRIVPRFTKV